MNTPRMASTMHMLLGVKRAVPRVAMAIRTSGRKADTRSTVVKKSSFRFGAPSCGEELRLPVLRMERECVCVAGALRYKISGRGKQ